MGTYINTFILPNGGPHYDEIPLIAERIVVTETFSFDAGIVFGTRILVSSFNTFLMKCVLDENL